MSKITPKPLKPEPPKPSKIGPNGPKSPQFTQFPQKMPKVSEKLPTICRNFVPSIPSTEVTPRSAPPGPWCATSSANGRSD